MLLTVILGVLFAALGGYMALTGRGSILIAGFNTMTDEEKAGYDAEGLCRFVGKFLALVGILTVLLAAALALNDAYGAPSVGAITIAYSLIVVGACIFAIVYLNTGNRFRK